MGRRKKEPTIEEALEELEILAERMEQEDITLEEAFTNYKNAMMLLKSCDKRVAEIEKRVLKLNEDGETDEF